MDRYDFNQPLNEIKEEEEEESVVSRSNLKLNASKSDTYSVSENNTNLSFIIPRQHAATVVGNLFSQRRL